MGSFLPAPESGSPRLSRRAPAGDGKRVRPLALPGARAFL